MPTVAEADRPARILIGIREVKGKEVTVVEPKNSWRTTLSDVVEFRDLLYFLIWRDIKVRYAQSVLGIGWAIIQPVFSMCVFTVIFGRVAKIGSDGIPYPLFSLCGLVPWTFISGSITGATESLVANSNMLKKIYFPRIFIPIAPVLGKTVDFFVSFWLLLVLMIIYGYFPDWEMLLLLPVFILQMVFTACGIGLWLSAFAVQYRDVKYGISFGIQLLLYSCPVIYPLSLIPSEYRTLYAINPMVGIIHGFRSAVISGGDLSFEIVLISLIGTLVIFVGGGIFFQYKERLFADVA